MAKTRQDLEIQITRIANAASERVRAHALESGDRGVLQLLDHIGDGKRAFGERAKYIDLAMSEAERLGDRERFTELRSMHDQLVRDLQQFKFLSETAFEFLKPLIEGGE
jgi:hypothetical protein